MAWNPTPEQQLAVDKDGINIIVSAGAGSGKTAVLTERVIQKLKKGVNINELLVLTFTKEAANEMKNRIRKAIKKDEAVKEQLDIIDAAYITTFDSYSLSIVKKYHYLLNVSKNISIIDSSIIALEKERILDKIFEEYYDSRKENFLKIINDLCIKDDQEIKKAIIDISNKLDLKLNKKEFLENIITNYFSEEFLNKKINEYVSLIKTKIDSLNYLSDKIGIYADGNYHSKILDVLLPLLNSETYDDMKKYINITLPNLPKNSPEELKKIKENLSKEIGHIKDYLIYEDTNVIKENLLLTKDYVEIISEIIIRLDDEILSYKAKYDTYEFNDIAKMAINVLKNNPDICEEIKKYYNEILIDEYQDTNDLQESFISLIENNNVYMVGDIKQSIYRFRNANPNIFKNKYDNYKNNNGGFKIDLLKNFRSRHEVLDDINTIFNIVMDDNIGGAEYIVSHQMVYGNTAYTELGETHQNNTMEIYNYPFVRGEYTKEELEIFIIANDIKNKIDNKYKIFDKDEKIIRDISYSDFCIIMDRNTEFDKYKRIFEYMQIPLTLYQDEKLTTEYDILVINNIMKLIIKIKNREFDSEFKYLYTSIARSFLFNIKDNDIFKSFYNNNFFNNDIYINASIIANDLDNIDNYTFLKRIIDSFKIYEKIITIGSIEKSMIRIDYLLNMANNLSSIGYNPINFTDYVTNMINGSNEIKYSLNTKAGNNVKIMNIHKSKGLEFSICYYSGLHKEFNTADLKERFTFSEEEGIITPYFKEGIGTSIYKDLLKDRYMKEEISEKIRLFYVAMTRCKEKMILVTSLDESESDSKRTSVVDDYTRLKYKSFKDILDSIRPNLEPYITNIDLEKIVKTKDYNIIKEVNFNEHIKPSNEVITTKSINIENETLEENHFSKKTNELITNDIKNAMELGTKLHYALETLDFNNPNIDELNISNYFKTKIKDFLNSKLLENIKESNIYKEYEFIYEEDNTLYHGIIDLMLEYNDHIDIIDYKLKETSDENYVKQLNGYKDFIEKKTNKKVYLYLYSIIDGTINDLN